MYLYLILLVIGIVAIIVLAVYITKHPKLKIPSQIVLLIVIIGLAYGVYESIMGPVRFNNEMKRRRVVVIERLKDIRIAQNAYRKVHKVYASDFDSLIHFLKNGQLILTKMNSTLPDSLSEIGDVEAIRLGYLTVDTTYVNAYESLFKGRENFNVDKLSYIPNSEGEKFKMDSGEIEKGKVQVPVFEVIAEKHTFLKGLDIGYVNNENVKDLKMGSMEEPSIDGNWE